MAFRGRVAVVFGGGSGMGRISARRLADAGAEVAVCDVSETGMAETAKGRSNIRRYVCDVSHEDAVVATVARIEKELGRIDRVTHTAAIMPAQYGIADDVDRVRRVMRVNYEGMVHVVMATLPKMLDRGTGDLIVYGSVAGQALSPQLSAYGASKAAVNAYVETLIYENRGRGVRIHLACPPMVDTPLYTQAIRTSSEPRLLELARERNLLAKPEAIVDAIEDALEKGRAVSYPHPMARALSLARRISPSMLWEMILRS